MRLIDADKLKIPSEEIIAKMAIAHAPTIEPKRGEWVYKPNDYDESTWECSNCKEPWTLIDGTPQDNNMNFCPNCGAIMKGADDEVR